jgi:hypothetical protein
VILIQAKHCQKTVETSLQYFACINTTEKKFFVQALYVKCEE